MGKSSDKEAKSRNKKGLERKLKIMTMVPVIFMGIVVTILSYYVFLYTVQKEVDRNLKNATTSIVLHFDELSDGDYRVEYASDDTYTIFKGERDLSDTQSFIERYKAETGLDLTVFYLDARVFSTLTDDKGNLIINTYANKLVSDAVINGNKDVFYNNIDIKGTKFFAYYTPLHNTDGKVIGMIFAGKPTLEVERDSMMSLVWIPVVTILMIVIGGWISLKQSRELIDVIKKEKKFLDEIAKGNLSAEIDQSIVKRDDELGDMGRFSRNVQKYIREMIERDTLTRLYTRRIGQSKINYVKNQLLEAGVKYSVCMGDIDYFKKVNDTYGHDAGDLVLRDVAHIFNENMLGHGFTVRWGGEELLTIFEDADIDKSYKILKDIREKIINHEMDYNGQIIKVTMTFGLTEGDERDIDDIVKEADNLLYYGKQNGRNRIVTSKDAEKMLQESGADQLAEK